MSETAAPRHHEEALFRIAFAHAPWGMVVCTPDGRYLRVNGSMCELVGFDEQELVGRTFRDITHPDDIGLTSDQLIEVGAAGHVEFEKRFVRKDGRIVLAKVTGSVVHDADGAPCLVVGQIRDVTEQRQRAQERRELEEQLRRSQRLDAVGRMAGGIAHDFNNMLSVILNYTEFVRQRVHDPSSLEYLAAIRQAAQRSAALTRQLLIFGRRDVAIVERLDLNRVIFGLEQMLRRTLGEDVECRLDLEPGLWPVELAPSHLEQILLNLTVNARDAMPRGGLFTIETRNVTIVRDGGPTAVPPGRWVRMTVGDNGEGMAPEVVALAFEPFFTTRPTGQGTGLGLSIVYGIVDEAGGHVHAESELGSGTAIHLHLPVRGGTSDPGNPL